MSVPDREADENIVFTGEMPSLKRMVTGKDGGKLTSLPTRLTASATQRPSSSGIFGA